MSDWFVNLSVVWMELVVFGLTYVVAALIYAVVVALARGTRASVFKEAPPGMLPPLGILFALFIAFTELEVSGNIGRANTAVDRETSAVKHILVLAASFPGEPEARLRALTAARSRSCTRNGRPWRTNPPICRSPRHLSPRPDRNSRSHAPQPRPGDRATRSRRDDLNRVSRPPAADHR